MEACAALNDMDLCFCRALRHRVELVKVSSRLAPVFTLKSGAFESEGVFFSGIHSS